MITKKTSYSSQDRKIRGVFPRWLFFLPILLPFLLTTSLYVYDFLIGVSTPYRIRATSDQLPVELGSEWQMHLIDNPGDWLPNGLDPFDVNGDGHEDYLVNYEYKGRMRVLFHPNEYPAAEAWPAVDAGYFPDAESSAMGDLSSSEARGSSSVGCEGALADGGW